MEYKKKAEDWITKKGKHIPLDENGNIIKPENQNKNKNGRKSAVEKLQELAKPKQGKNKAEFFGVEYKGFKGADAVEKLLQEKQGHVKNAFERREVGGIDLVWGDKNGGLQHAIRKRDKMFAKGDGKITGLEMVRKIPEIMEKGEFGSDEIGRLKIEHGNYRVGINPTYFNDKVNWIVTAMEIKEEAPK